jgi:uncharacterized protein YqfB (UPF0267 family)
MTEDRIIKTHHLKAWPEFFDELLCGRKTFEIRKNDRNYQEGDYLVIKEWNPDTKEYTHAIALTFEVTSIMCGSRFGLAFGWCIMSIRPA